MSIVPANLFICDTPFHVLTSLIIASGEHTNGANDFILTDNMSNVYSLADSLSKSSLADNAYVAKTKHAYGNPIHNKVEYFRDIFESFSLRWDFPTASKTYNSLFVRNYRDPIAVSAYSYFKEKNDDLSFVVYDEGYSSYTQDYWTANQTSAPHKAAEFIARVFRGKQDTSAHISKALLYTPQFLDFKLPFPAISLLPPDFQLDGCIISEIIFGFDPSFFNEIAGKNEGARKYLFFEESFATDRGNDADLGILDEVAEIVGKENVFVKLHPRTSIDRFTPLGYAVLKGANYPWEVCALNAPKECPLTLVSFSSGSLLNYHFICDRAIKSVFLYELYPDACQTMDDDVKRFFAKFISRYPEGVSVPATKAELREALS